MQGRAGSVKCQAGQDAKLGHKRVLLLAHGKKAEKPEFKEAYAWLEKAGHDIDMIKTSSPEDMSKGVEKMITRFHGTLRLIGHRPSPTKQTAADVQESMPGAACTPTLYLCMHTDYPPCSDKVLHVHCHLLLQPFSAMAYCASPSAVCCCYCLVPYSMQSSCHFVTCPLAMQTMTSSLLREGMVQSTKL